MTQFKDIQTKIKLFYLILFGKIKKENNLIEISQKNKKPIKNILIIFPVKESSFRVAIYSFRSLSKNENINYYFIVNSVYQHHFNLSGHVFNLYHTKQKNKIDETFYDERIINKSFDIIIDLNNEFVYDICYMINKIKGYYKIGFNHNYSDYFYNIQLKTDVLENSYNKIKQMIN